VVCGDLIEAGQWADVALGFEEGVRDDEAEWATIARRSSSEWKLEVHGRQAYSSGIFEADVGAGAIFEASRILNGFYDEMRGEEYLTFNAGAIVGGTDFTWGGKETPGHGVREEQRRAKHGGGAGRDAHHLRLTDRAGPRRHAGGGRAPPASDVGRDHLQRRVSGHALHGGEPGSPGRLDTKGL